MNRFLPIHIAMCAIGAVSSALISILYMTDLDDKCRITAIVETNSLSKPLIEASERKDFEGEYLQS
jgi:hypothetical protein